MGMTSSSDSGYNGNYSNGSSSGMVSSNGGADSSFSDHGRRGRYGGRYMESQQQSSQSHFSQNSSLLTSSQSHGRFGSRNRMLPGGFNNYNEEMSMAPLAPLAPLSSHGGMMEMDNSEFSGGRHSAY